MNSREQKKLQTRYAFFNAVLDLCMTGQSFGSISLRQVTREVGVVPTAFYRHFDDMEMLGKSLVEDELGTALSVLRDRLQIGRTRSFDRQIAKSIQLFFQSVDEHPRYWQFMVSERFGGSEAVRTAIDNQIKLFAKIVGADLGLQPAFAHIDDNDRQLLAAAGLNLFLSWVIDWLDLTYTAELEDEIDEPALEAKKQQQLHRCTRQAQMLFYGAENWKSSEQTILEE
ncbi:TetR family transcriptional regulator [Psychrobacter sp. I-STPA6b]|uniref:TetR family transcriptional regulator n=1 Tax=Psychrobacter sp. I-STPA6b TaxID=2585718 RepID=UPI001D0C4E80|nr:TetR family transcriptional regulator [Psychrobacter sp. I-STPA6b]